jgi:hypothetical protein
MDYLHIIKNGYTWDLQGVVSEDSIPKIKKDFDNQQGKVYSLHYALVSDIKSWMNIEHRKEAYRRMLDCTLSAKCPSPIFIGNSTEIMYLPKDSNRLGVTSPVRIVQEPKCITFK